ncbi:hypothetical protein GCK72_018517 [Caenorhabditis remanei]|uniref:Headcase N-terminal domain-containing protein n=1 Tax=Caenorhabditis remanei TaxID=31234 RepID=A0A6A5GBB7_CAERE|nr:hypothetical protein GCK72_018517 [Caenorhabditis remanei]KAF1751963.1 hypothetical protein GCK72_018517 [Caenorhabditis remanei]
MPKGQRKLEIVKRRQTTSGDREGSSSVAPVIGCPVLDPIQCQCPKEEVNPSEGVKMTCTWESCPYSNQPLHTVCYQLLEDNLVKRLATLGSARGWTVPQRRNNLWERKGQSLIGKFCRCRCDRGQMTRDKQALYEKEKAVEKEKKKKAKKAKQLPVLHFNSKPLAAIEEKKRDGGFNSPSAISSHHQTFSTTSRSRLHTDRSTSSMRTYTVARTWSESSFAGETNGQYDNNEDFHPSDCDCVFHYDYDADEDNDHDHIEEDFLDISDARQHLEVIVPAPTPPPQVISYAATIRNTDNKVVRDLKSANSPDSGIGQATPRLSFSSSNEDDNDNRQGGFPPLETEREKSERINPLGLSILSSIEVSSTDENQAEEPDHFLELTDTPHLSMKRETLRTKKSISVSKLPLATPTQLYSDEPRCGFRFNAPVREMMDMWNEATSSNSKCSIDDKDEKQEALEICWTPFFGRGFNLGERLFYFP